MPVSLRSAIPTGINHIRPPAILCHDCVKYIMLQSITDLALCCLLCYKLAHTGNSIFEEFNMHKFHLIACTVHSGLGVGIASGCPRVAEKKREKKSKKKACMPRGEYTHDGARERKQRERFI